MTLSTREAPSPASVRPPATARSSAPPTTAPATATAATARGPLPLYALIAALALALGVARLVTGPWFHVYNPRELALIDGFPVSWEATYYTDHLPTIASPARPAFGISAVHYRTLLPLFLAAQLYALTGTAFWSFAAVDLLFWALAGVAGFHLALRLGARPWGAALGALLLTASPLFASHMWRHDLHTADFAGLPIALWATVLLVDEPRPRWQLAGALALVLLLLSLSYQYQWLVAPLAFVLCATQPRVGWRWGAAATGAALLGYLALTAATESLFRAAVGPPTTWTGAVVSPLPALLGDVTRARTASEALAALVALLPSARQVLAVVQAYHPLVFGAGLLGTALLGRRPVALLATGLAVSLASHRVYEAPWTAALCFPLIALGAGVACAAAGAALAGSLAPLVPRHARHAATTSPPLGSVGAYACGAALAFVCAAVTNLDLAGVPDFALTWWRSYTHMRSHF